MDDRDNSNLRSFVRKLNREDFPEGYRESPIWKDGHTRGHQTGYMKGLHDAWLEADTVINSVRNIIELHDRRHPVEED